MAMGEKTLQQVGEEAANSYSRHSFKAKMVKAFEDRVQEVDSPLLLLPGNTALHEEVKKNAQDQLDTAKESYDTTTMKGAEFAADNAEQLHDLAVMEAHLGGVAINVEQPIVDGQKIEVHQS